MADLNRLFHPRSVAIVGSLNSITNRVQTLFELGFEGKIYPISHNANEIRGLKVYTSIGEVPGEIDIVIVMIPARFTPQLMEECVRKSVSFAQFFTAGFSEVGADGSALEKEVVEIAARGGVRVVGPNCMGVYCPGDHFCWRNDFPRESGEVAFLSQSGWHSGKLAMLGATREVRFSKMISYGNAADLNEIDFLKYFATDQESRVIGAYIEGVKDGQQFFQALRKTAQVKPVLVLKGGHSQAGMRVVESHTGSLAGNDVIWESLLRQAGAVEVHSLDELVDAALAFLYLTSIRSGDIAVICTGGGPGVISADECERAGLTMPPLPEEAVKALRRFIRQEGTGLRNPLDLPFINEQTPQQLHKALGIVASCPEIDSLIVNLEIDIVAFLRDEKRLTKITTAIIAASRDCGKPVSVVLSTSGFPETLKIVLEQQRLLMAAGIPVYPSISRAARAINRVLQYKFSKS
ncbi:acetate--CoA ligase family protein [Chloroflexota bacterium]